MGSLFNQGQVLKFDELLSTNSYTSSLPQGSAEGTIVLANFQTQGRGQGGNFWESEKGKNLTFSILLKPHFLKATGQFYISKIISLAVADFVSLFVENVFIKWPNDIYVGDKKIGGILIENSIEGQYITQSIVGIGLNLNQKKFLSDAPNPVSMSLITNEGYDVEDMLDTLKDLIENRYEMLKNKEYKTLDENYIDVLYRFGKKAPYKSDNESFNGTITGVEPSGELIILDDNGQTRKFFYKEVSFL